MSGDKSNLLQTLGAPSQPPVVLQRLDITENILCSQTHQLIMPNMAPGLWQTLAIKLDQAESVLHYKTHQLRVSKYFQPCYKNQIDMAEIFYVVKHASLWCQKQQQPYHKDQTRLKRFYVAKHVSLWLYLYINEQARLKMFYVVKRPSLLRQTSLKP